MVAEWAYEQLQIQVAETNRSQVQIPLGTIIYMVIICNRKIYTLWTKMIISVPMLQSNSYYYRKFIYM